MAAGSHNESEELARTPLHAQHVALGARMVPFAGYDMPVQYRDGIIAEHNWTRTHAGLFDVSTWDRPGLSGSNTKPWRRRSKPSVPLISLDSKKDASVTASCSMPRAASSMTSWCRVRMDRQRDGRLFLIVNAARKAVDYQHIAHRLPPGVHLVIVEDRALLALQGPQAHEVAASLGLHDGALNFMETADAEIAGIACHVFPHGLLPAKTAMRSPSLLTMLSICGMPCSPTNA